MKAVVLALVASLLSSGCAAMATHAGTTHAEVVREGCPSKVAAGFDTYWAVSTGLGGVAVLSDSGNGDSTKAGLLMLGLAAAFAASAHHGFAEVNQCRALRDEPESYEVERPAMPELASEPAPIRERVITVDAETGAETETYETRSTP